MTNYAHVLEVLLRLRQACNHMSLCKDFSDKPTEEDLANVQRLIELLKEGEGQDCCICLTPMSDPVITKCAHIYCRACIQKVLETNSACPLCRSRVTPTELIEKPEEQEQAIQINELTLASSSKVNTLIKHLLTLQFHEPSAKCLVYSQWSSMLNIVANQLEQNGINYVRLDGSINQVKRQEAIERFRKDDSVKVFLITLKAGGVGITLTEANHVFLLDPWWNGAAEEQAIDRCHRLGQTKPVHVVRFVCSDTIEEKVIELQTKKKQVIQGVLEMKSRGELQQMKTEDLKLLFSFT